MLILAASLQKTGEFFLHAGYMSSPGADAGGLLPLLIAGAFLLPALVVFNAIFEKPRSKAIACMVIVIFLFYWVLGCAVPHGAG